MSHFWGALHCVLFPRRVLAKQEDALIPVGTLKPRTNVLNRVDAGNHVTALPPAQGIVLHRMPPLSPQQKALPWTQTISEYRPYPSGSCRSGRSGISPARAYSASLMTRECAGWANVEAATAMPVAMIQTQALTLLLLAASHLPVHPQRRQRPQSVAKNLQRSLLLVLVILEYRRFLQ